MLACYAAWRRRYGRLLYLPSASQPHSFASRRNDTFALHISPSHHWLPSLQRSILPPRNNMKTSLYAFVTLGCLLYSAYGLPAPTKSNGRSKPYPPNYKKSIHHRILTTEQLQFEQPPSNLPSNSNVTLVYSTLGIGHQNYTCNGTAFVQTKPGDGATALLYDTTEFLERNPDEINTLAQDCNYRKCKYPQLLSRLLGNHYFSAAIIPTFDLSHANPPLILSAVKSGDVPAPESNNIDWLFLTANPPDGISRGLSEVYRIDTFHGKAPASCHNDGQTTSIPYTAQYWFYD